MSRVVEMRGVTALMLADCVHAPSGAPLGDFAATRLLPFGLGIAHMPNVVSVRRMLRNVSRGATGFEDLQGPGVRILPVPSDDVLGRLHGLALHFGYALEPDAFISSLVYVYWFFSLFDKRDFVGYFVALGEKELGGVASVPS